MNDVQIIELFWQRDETALLEVENKYANYCFAIAWKILMSKIPKNVSTIPGWRHGIRFRQNGHRYSQAFWGASQETLP